jgi:hypothetical protein
MAAWGNRGTTYWRLMAYYIRLRGQQQGPFTAEQLHKLAARGRFSRHYEVSTDGVSWSRAEGYSELFPPIPVPVRRKTPLEPEPTSAAAPNPEYGVAASNEPVPEEWFYASAGAEQGPVTLQELKRLIGLGEVTSDDHVWTEGMANWHRVRDVPELSRQFVTAQQPAVEVLPEGETTISGLAITSFILALLGVSILFFLASVPAVAFGHVALAQIRKSRGRLGGRGLAIAGLALGYVVVVPVVITAIVYAAILALAPRGGGEAASTPAAWLVHLAI